jgi:hypothetical protein
LVNPVTRAGGSAVAAIVTDPLANGESLPLCYTGDVCVTGAVVTGKTGAATRSSERSQLVASTEGEWLHAA